MQTTNTPDATVDGERERLPPIGALLKAIGTFGNLDFQQDGQDARDVLAEAIAWWEVDFAEFVQKHIDLESQVSALRADAARFRGLINTPHTDDWFSAVRLEAAHQIERWGADHDTGKQPHDWFWLLGYLGGKALASAMSGNIEKAKHHTISSGAALLNWFRALTGDSTRMRPGIDTPSAASIGEGGLGDAGRDA